MADVLTKITLVCQNCGHQWDRTLSLPPGCAPPTPDVLKSCVNCSQFASMLDGMSEPEIMESKLAHRVAAERHFLPDRTEQTAERAKTWRAGNMLWARMSKVLRRAGVKLTKDAASEFMEKWIVKIVALGDSCSFCPHPCTPDTVQFWRDPAGDPLDPQSYWPVCRGCAGRKRAEVRWKK